MRGTYSQQQNYASTLKGAIKDVNRYDRNVWRAILIAAAVAVALGGLMAAL